MKHQSEEYFEEFFTNEFADIPNNVESDNKNDSYSDKDSNFFPDERRKKGRNIIYSK